MMKRWWGCGWENIPLVKRPFWWSYKMPWGWWGWYWRSSQPCQLPNTAVSFVILYYIVCFAHWDSNLFLFIRIGRMIWRRQTNQMVCLILYLFLFIYIFPFFFFFFFTKLYNNSHKILLICSENMQTIGWNLVNRTIFVIWDLEYVQFT